MAANVLQALKWLLTLQVKEVEIECDFLLTVTALHKKTDYYVEVGFTLKDCISILRSRPDFSVEKASHYGCTLIS